MRDKRFTLLNPTMPIQINITGLKLFALLLIGFGISGLQAQEAIPATGGEASGNGGSVSYSVGQVIYTTGTSTNSGTVSQGVQQPYTISVVTSLEEAQKINLMFSAYPNPTTDYLTLSADESDVSGLSYRLYDASGKLLETKAFGGNQIKIAMGHLVPAIYYVKVIAKTQNNASQQEIKTFKIIKQ